MLAIWVLAAGCMCIRNPVPAWFRTPPAPIESPAAACRWLKPEVNGALSWPARALGVVTTPFKNVGFIGWTNLGMRAAVIGRVEHAAASTDRFLTVDVGLERIVIDDLACSLDSPRYLRSEVCLCMVPLAADERPRTGDRVEIDGRLVWDGDGFLEVHPEAPGDVHVLSRPSE